MPSDHEARPAANPIILGIGTGQCGTRALAALLNSQPDAHVTHEDPPLLPWRRNPKWPGIRERLGRFRTSRPQRFIGDVAHYYLPYVEEAIALEPGLRIICLERARDEVISGFDRWLGAAHPMPMDHWSARPLEGSHHDLIWTRTFPQYETQGREEGIGRYWDEYHSRARDLSRRFPENVRVFPTRGALGMEAGQRDLLTFAGIPRALQVLLAVDWEGSDLPAQEHPRRSAWATADPNNPRRCVVLVPYSGSIVPNCEAALRGLERRGYEVWRVGGFAAIDEGRSHMATAALTEGFDETMWIDADIEFEPEAVCRLRAHEEPIVCGIYAQKGRRALACHAMPETEKFVFGGGGGLSEILYAAGGFLLVRRHVYLEIQQRLDLPVCNEQFDRPMVPFFQPLIRSRDDGTWYLAEDYAFCERARRCGFRIMADTTIRLWHFGHHPYSWEDSITEVNRYKSVTVHIK